MTDDDESATRRLPASGAATTQMQRPSSAPIATDERDTLTEEVEPARTRPSVTLPPMGYALGEVIGRGGMGEVIAAVDQRIGREVAIKRMRAANPDEEQLARFLREARIQARLDHPAIVPVHELGTDPSGRPYFTMKRVSGSTLGERMADGASLQSLLRAFVDVCLAIELAHSRGVVHRDLKPANIMLGDYGEVYVLDWGVARVLSEQRAPTHTEVDTLDDGTQTGALLGTPGFISPEQIKGEAATAPADVYALGAILFEILAGEPLHPRGTAAIGSTLSSPQHAPAHRRSDRSIAPELDAACFDALAEEPAKRPTARVLADQVQAYLDGDRDVERRCKLAVEQLATARAALASDAADGRATAIRSAGRALALDPESTAAAELVTSLIVQPPSVYPPALVASLDKDERAAVSQRSQTAVASYLGLFVLWIAIPFINVIHWGSVIAFYVVAAGLAVFSLRAARIGHYNLVVGVVGNLTLALVFSRLAGPFVLTPLLICGPLIALTANRWMIRRRWGVVAYVAVGVMAPIVLEWMGVLSSTWSMTIGEMSTHSQVIQMGGALGKAMLIAGTIAFTAMIGMIAMRMHRGATEARRQLHIQAWQMRQLLPNDPGGWIAG